MQPDEIDHWERVGVLMDRGFRPNGTQYINGPVHGEIDGEQADFYVNLPNNYRNGEELARAISNISDHQFSYSDNKLISSVQDPLNSPEEIDRILEGFKHIRLPNRSQPIRQPRDQRRPPRALSFYMALVFSRYPFKENCDLDTIAEGPFLNFERDQIRNQATSYAFSPTKYQLGQISLRTEQENMEWIIHEDDMELTENALHSKNAYHLIPSTIEVTTCDWEVDAKGVSKEDSAVPRFSVVTGMPFEEDEELFTPNFSVSGDSPIMEYGRAKGAQKAKTTYIFTERDLGAINHLAKRQPYIDMHEHGIFFFREGRHTYEVKDLPLRTKISEAELHFLDPFSGLALTDTAPREMTENDIFRIRELRRAIYGRYMTWRRDGNGFTKKTRPYREVDESIWAVNGPPYLSERENWEERIDQEKWRQILHPKIIDFFDQYAVEGRDRKMHYSSLLTPEEKAEVRESGWTSWPQNKFLPLYAVKIGPGNEILTAEIRPVKG